METGQWLVEARGKGPRILLLPLQQVFLTILLDVPLWVRVSYQTTNPRGREKDSDGSSVTPDFPLRIVEETGTV